MLETPKQQESAQQTQGHAKDNISSVVWPASAAIPQPPPSPSENRTPTKRRRWIKDPGMFWVTLAGVIAVLLYTCVSKQQLDVMQGQLDSMERDELPYLSVTEKTEDPIYKQDGRVHWNWHFTNFGKGRAVNVSGDQFLGLGNNGLRRVRGQFFIATVTQGRDDFGTAVSDPITQEDFNKYLSMQGGFILLVEFKYTDLADINPEHCAKYKQKQ
jgi:hypothetical protein